MHGKGEALAILSRGYPLRRATIVSVGRCRT